MAKDLKKRTKQFAVAIIRVVASLPRKTVAQVIRDPSRESLG